MALARVNTFLRRLLMSCKSEPIWRSARLNCVDLPPRPKELSEPVYAALLFSKICTSCGRRALQNMDPVLQGRLCAKCKKDQLIDLSEHDIDTSLVFVSTNWSERGPWCFKKDAQAVKGVLESFDAAGNEEGKQNWMSKGDVL
ncbi:F-box protein [Rhizoctonia solani]|uniref:F-box protein n=1 Tax=Rhizoctonia solani TaxID=456999 RepID=A0A8H8P9L1_9AGAM|nr:F-box protein [Rhizoctonia solani]QRW25982.1 F-box protein [Rhizoctonia solani]